MPVVLPPVVTPVIPADVEHFPLIREDAPDWLETHHAPASWPCPRNSSSRKVSASVAGPLVVSGSWSTTRGSSTS